jgi:hypothetical protein
MCVQENLFGLVFLGAHLHNRERRFIEGEPERNSGKTNTWMLESIARNRDINVEIFFLGIPIL